MNKGAELSVCLSNTTIMQEISLLESMGMKLSNVNITRLKIDDYQDLDTITVYIENYEKGKGIIIIECFGEAWAQYWPAMGDKTVEEFFVSCGHDYLLSCIDPESEKEKHILRIIGAVKWALK